MNTNQNPNNFIPLFPTTAKTDLKTSTQGNLFLQALETLKTGDDMDCLSCLMNLTVQLSIASDTIGGDPNICELLDEMLNMLEKIYIPELVLSSLQCINYILDINPAFGSIIRKGHGLQKILTLMSSVDDITCIENAVNALEKISYEHSIALLENNALELLMNCSCFLSSGNRKALMRTCLNLCKSATKYELYAQAIQPVLPSLTFLTKLNDSDIQTNSTAILCFNYLASNIKVYDFKHNSANVDENLLQYGLIDNLSEIVIYYIQSQNEKKIGQDMIRNILKTFYLLCTMSGDVTNFLLSSNILSLIFDLLKTEFTGINQNQKFSSFLIDIFPLFEAFFPQGSFDNSTSSIACISSDLKIMSDTNSQHYTFFAEKILQLIINQVMVESSCTALYEVLVFLNIFVKCSNKIQILAYLDPCKISKIVGKLIDSQYVPYLPNVAIMLEMLMQKAPGTFLVPFMREGIIENLQQYKIAYQDTPPSIPQENPTEAKNLFLNSNSNSNINPTIAPYDKSSKVILNTFSSPEEDDNSENLSYEEKEEIQQADYEVENASAGASVSQVMKLPPEECVDVKEPQGKEILKEFKPKITIHDILKEKQKLIYQAEKKLLLNRNPFEASSSMSNSQLKLLDEKVKMLIQKYFSNDAVQNLLQSEGMTENPLSVLTKLSEKARELNVLSCCDESESEQQIKPLLTQIISILSDTSHQLTLWEIEKSEVLISICNFLEENFLKIYQQITSDDDEQLHFEGISHLLSPEGRIHIEESEKKNIVKRIQLLCECFENSPVRFKEFINTLQFTVRSMNCFTMVADDFSQGNINQIYNSMFREEKKLPFKFLYHEESFPQLLANEDIAMENEFIDKLRILHNIFSSQKEARLILSFNETVKDACQMIAGYYNINELLQTQSGELRPKLNFFFDSKLNIKFKFPIQADWTFKEMLFQLKKVVSKEEVRAIVMDGFPISFELNYSRHSHTDVEQSSQVNFEKKSESIFNIITDLSTACFNDKFDTILFEKYYYPQIIQNKSLFEMKRLSPSLFLLSILNLALGKYRRLFRIENIIDINSDELSNLFENSKVTSLIFKASRDGYSVSRNAIPSWCRNLSCDFTFISNFNSRYLLFKVSFDPKRGMINLQNYMKSFSGEGNSEQSISKDKSIRQKIIVEREAILSYAWKVMKETMKYYGYLEFEYVNEIGNGLGPTLEFYSLVIEKIREENSLWYKTTDGSLFPLPLNNDKAVEMFQLIGFIIARALYDDRLLDIPLSSLFWDIALQMPVNANAILQIDSHLGKAFLDFIKIIHEKHLFILNHPNCLETDSFDLGEEIKYNSSRIDELGILFNLPGYPDIPLKDSGLEILLTVHNIDEYTTLLFDTLLGNGIKPHIEAFRKGFNQVFDIRSLRCFTSHEIEDCICGSGEIKWDSETLHDHVKPDHGLTKNCSTFHGLIRFMLELDNMQKKKFLLFVTGSPRLPLGGFKNLNPKLTVVRRKTELYQNPDDYLPTVMTCQNYLKLPDYSCYEVLKEKILTAMNEGGNEFHLS